MAVESTPFLLMHQSQPLIQCPYFRRFELVASRSGDARKANLFTSNVTYRKTDQRHTENTHNNVTFCIMDIVRICVDDVDLTFPVTSTQDTATVPLHRILSPFNYQVMNFVRFVSTVMISRLSIAFVYLCICVFTFYYQDFSAFYHYYENVKCKSKPLTHYTACVDC